MISRTTGEQRLWGCDHADKRYPHLYVATYEAMVDTKRVTPALIKRMCIGYLSGHTGGTQANRVAPETVSTSKGPAAEIMAELGVVVSIAVSSSTTAIMWTAG